MESTKTKGYRQPRAPKIKRGERYPFKLRLKTVKLCLEEGYPISLASRETGVSQGSIGRWIKRYKTEGESGLHMSRPRGA